MIPASIDLVAVIRDLNRWGFGNSKIEVICGLADGHVTHFVAGRRNIDSYHLVARVYNFWLDECRTHGSLVPWQPAADADVGQHMAATT